MKRRHLSIALTMCLSAAAAVEAQPASSAEQTAPLKSIQPTISEQYGDIAQKLIAAALADNNSTARLQYLCDRIGNRLGGSASLERAIEWSAAEMKKAGLTNVQTPPVKVPHWVRGKESAVMLAPVHKPLMMIGWGMSPGTPPEGITADVVAVTSPDQLTSLGRDKVAGKIVLFIPTDPSLVRLVMTGGPGRAATLGAVAVLIRSGYSMQTPHTAGLVYEEGVPKLPAAAVSVEDAAIMQRLVEGGTPVRVQLRMEAHQEPDADSHNVMGEIRGREKPEEVVVLTGHADCWDIGQGAEDDASGMMDALEAVALIKKLGLQPRRTIRVLFYVAEENGGAGGRAYLAMLGDAVKNHVAQIDDDRGAEKPVGFGFGGAKQQSLFPAAFQRAVEIGELLKSIESGKISSGGGGGHIGMPAHGVPVFGMQTVNIHYDETHHTNADSFDKIVPRDFQLHVASLAVLSYVLADMPERLSEMK